MAPLAFVTARRAQYLLIEAAPPGRPVTKAGVLLIDPDRDRLHIKLREDWEGIADPDDAEVLSALAADLERQAREIGAERTLAVLEDSLSNTLRVGGRESIAVGDFNKALARLYERHIESAGDAPVEVLKYRTHLPLYPLAAAAGKWGEDMEVDVEPEGWAKAPEGLRLGPDMFVARVVGRSMEPLIPDGSLCVFRGGVQGSRQGKHVLVQNRGASETGGEFTVKRYTSRKVQTEEGWHHERIRMEPLNPEFEAWDLDPSDLGAGGRYRLCAEFVRVLPYEDH